MVQINSELALCLLISFRDRPGHKNSWPMVENEIKRFAEQNRDKLPKDVYLSIHYLNRKILHNFERRGTPLDPRVYDLLNFFFQSEMFLSQVPYAREIIQRREKSIEGGRALSSYIGKSGPDPNKLFSDITGYFIAVPVYYDGEQIPNPPDWDERDGLGIKIITFSETLYIKHPFNEPFAFIHCYRDALEPDTRDFDHYNSFERRPPIVLSGYIFKGESKSQFRVYLYSKFSGKFSFELAINSDQHEEIIFNDVKCRCVQSIKLSNGTSYHPSVAGLGQLWGEAYAGPLTNRQFCDSMTYKAEETNEVFDKIKESIITNE